MSAAEGAESIKIHTTRFGELEVSRASLIQVVAGLVGFPQSKSFVLLDYTAPFSWLQSTENPDLAFVVVNAAEFGDNYVFELPFGDRELELGKDDEVAIFNVVSIRPNAVDSTVNLKAPVIVNLRNRRGRQIILDDPRFPTRMPLWSGDSAEGEESK
ncbi:MAG: flagellar assembly protein FliW [Deltaproteobacteria bacterium]|nr:flagellar assembly protein FliW [Deltaproteobacteria bacterium]